MRIGVALSNDDAGIDPQLVVQQARSAEELGFASVWLPDHLLPPKPYGPVYGGVYEPLVLLGHIAAITNRITLGTSVIIAPLREPVLLAKQLATVERLAPGRLIAGFGVGWEPAEFEALAVPFAERGRRTDHLIDLVNLLHSHDIDDNPARPLGVFAPPPTARLPIMIGGTSAAALRRAARVADLWQAFGLTPDEFTDHRARLNALAGTRPIDTGTLLSRSECDVPVDELVALLARWRDTGADEVVVHFGPSCEVADRMAAFRDRAKSLFIQ